MNKASRLQKQLFQSILKKKKNRKIGLAPGSLIFTGEKKMDTTKISVTIFSSNSYEEIEDIPLDELLLKLNDCTGIFWINIDGLHEEEVIARIGAHFDIHKLTLEDILSVGQRPKLEESDTYLLTILRMFMVIQPNEINEEQLSLILKDNILISFQEKTGDVFEGVRQRLRESRGLIRTKGADYLMYALMDSVVDHYFLMLDSFGEQLENIELELMDEAKEEHVEELHRLRKESIGLRRSVFPLREVINKFEKSDSPLITSATQLFIRDLYDHIIQVSETIEGFREMASGLLDFYMNRMSQRMNEIMKVLTIMSASFIPLTFIAGIYGMNFNVMPELQFRYGYFIVLACMVFIFLCMIVYFKRKKWI